MRVPELAKPLERTAVLVMAIALSAACGESVTQVGPDDVTALRITPDSVTVGVGRSIELQALPLDAGGAFLPRQTVVWSSSIPGVAAVDSAGVVTGVGPGVVEVTATSGSVSGMAVVEVRQPPVLQLSADTVSFTASTIGLNPPPDSVLVTNGGEIDLTGLAIDSISYGPGAQGWISGLFRSPTAPTALIIEARTTAIGVVGDYEASVWVSAFEADGSPARVTVLLTLNSDPPLLVPTVIAVASGDLQTQVTGLNLPIAPTVTVLDQFGQPLRGAVVDFVPSGSGVVGASSAVTNASGLATTTWTVDVGGTVLQDDGTYPNTLTAEVQGTALSVMLSASAIYSYTSHVNPVLCVGCHAGVPPAAGLSLDGDAASDYDELVLEAPTCDDDGTALPASYRRVSTAGGVQAADDLSILLRYLDPALSVIGACDFGAHPKPLTADQLEVVRAWIRNGAPNN